ncbi:hypothetical protein QN277_003793 [Acacia crassicarpa]|uniref:Retrotransposon gag domain-containing protein n=1 Tax=Acacia crassicarpa TaxID=499986 RepID=A0AAE1J2Y8_9FABA|nr:hypothetical protein QN277_003793 [Acacia crassicarpa]
MRSIVDASSGGSILMKSYEEAHDLLERMAMNSHQWPADRATSSRTVAGVHELDAMTALAAQVSSLTHIVKGLTLPSSNTSLQPSQVACVYCGGEHLSSQCSANPESINFINNFSKGSNTNNPYLKTYNPGWRQHPNFSWNSQGSQAAGQSSAPQYSNRTSNPPGFTQQARQQGSESDPQHSMLTLLKDYMAKDDAIIQNQQVTLRNLENQVGQLATTLNNRPSGALPNDTEVPRIQGREEVKMIELQSGKSLEPMKATKQPMVVTDLRPEKFKEGQESTEHPDYDLGTATLPPCVAMDEHVQYPIRNATASSSKQSHDHGPSAIPKPPSPFPQRLKKQG